LTPEPPSADLTAFASVAGINLVHLPVLRTSSLNGALQSVLVSALNLCINSDSHPILVHCLDGRRITGLVVLLIRRLQGWTPLPSMNEFWRYQVALRSPIQASEIERTTRELEKITVEIVEAVIIPERIPSWLWMGNRKTSVPGIKIKYVPSLADSASSPDPVSLTDSNGSGLASLAGPDRATLLRQGAGTDKILVDGRSKTIEALSLHGLDFLSRKQRTGTNHQLQQKEREKAAPR